MGLANGKTEAWYVLTAAPDAKVALGLSRRLTPQELREAIDDDSIADLIAWHAVSANDVIFVPGRTIHTIGAGLIIAELQQRSDATFRLFDPGRQRDLHIEDAIRVADAGPADFEMRPNQLTAERRLLVSNPHFVFERIDLAANSSWYLEAERETWFLVLSGSAVAGSFEVALGDALFAQLDRVEIDTGASGMVGLVAYTGGGPVSHLLQRLTRPGPNDAGRPRGLHMPIPLIEAKPASKDDRLETTK
jgi:mannose-6-phosphate isomerase